MYYSLVQVALSLVRVYYLLIGVKDIPGTYPLARGTYQGLIGINT